MTIDFDYYLTHWPVEQQAICTALISVLDQLQDYFSEASTDPWPAKSHTHPEPFVEVGAREVRWGYGDPEAPVLELPPLAMADLPNAP